MQNMYKICPLPSQTLVYSNYNRRGYEPHPPAVCRSNFVQFLISFSSFSYHFLLEWRPGSFHFGVGSTSQRLSLRITESFGARHLFFQASDVKLPLEGMGRGLGKERDGRRAVVGQCSIASRRRWIRDS